MKHLIVIGSAFAATLGMAIVSTGGVAASEDEPAASSPKFYMTRVTDILSDNCLSCHDDTAKGGLRLDSYKSIMKGGNDGPVIIPGNPDTSMLILAIRRTGDLKMPPSAPARLTAMSTYSIPSLMPSVTPSWTGITGSSQPSIQL